MTLSNAERGKRFRAKKRAEKAAEATRADTDPGPNAPNAPPSEDTTALLDQFCAGVGPKPNARPIQPGESDSDDKEKPQPGAPQPEHPPMALPPAVWKLIDVRLRAFFEEEIKENPDMAPTPLDNETAKYMSEALGEGMAHSKMTMNPWYGFGIVVFMFILPYILLAVKKFSKKKKKKERDTLGELAELGVPVPAALPRAVQPIAPALEPARGAVGAGGDGGGLVGDLGARDAKLAKSRLDSGAPADGQNNAGIQITPEV